MSNILNHFDGNLKGLLEKKMTSQVLKRIAIILLYLLDIKVKQISAVLQCSEKTAYQTIKKYRSFGIANILEKQHSGRKSLLSIEESSQLKNNVNIKNSHESQNKVVHVEIINDLVEKNKGKRFSRSGIYSFCKKNGIRKVKPRPVHVKNDPIVMEKWKKNLSKIIDKVKKDKPNKRVVLYYQDETRYGQKTITSGIWSPKEVRPEYKN